MRYLLFVLAWWGVMEKSLAQTDPPAILQDRYFPVQGVVKSAAGSVLVGANVSILETGQGVQTDENGFFTLSVVGGKNLTLEIRYVGYASQRLPVVVKGPLTLLVKLQESLQVLEAVTVVEGGVDRNLSTAELGAIRLNSQSLRQLPTLLGEADVVRSIQILPGVTSVGESATGFNVRGGNIDQNLVLLDNIPLFNTGHLIGFFSVFNPDLVREMTFYRGSIPAQYGGRAAAVLDVRLREPNRDSLAVSGSLGLISSRLLVETPLLGRKAALAIGGRVSFADYLFKSFLPTELKETEANYRDLTAKFTWRPSTKDFINTTFFLGSDAFRIAGDTLAALEVNATSTRYRWQTLGSSVQWSHFYQPNTGFRVEGFVSRYEPSFDLLSPNDPATLAATVQLSGVRLEWLQQGADLGLVFGAQWQRYQIDPGSLVPSSPNSSFNAVTLPQEQANEAAGYANINREFFGWLEFNAGLRFTHYDLRGPGRVFQYQPGLPREVYTISDTATYARGRSLQSYSGLEPRLGLRLRLGEQTALKLGYHRIYQFLHLISNTTAALPTDRWKLSDPYLRPQATTQYAVGLFQNFHDNRTECSLEAYYKTTDHQPDYRSGANLLLLAAPETAILQGQGRAYGLELMLRHRGTRWEAWLAYTLARAEILVNSPYPEDRVFSGQTYLTNYHRPHSLNLQASYRFNRRVQVSAIFSYLAGRPATFPGDRFAVSNIFIPYYSSRNGDRTPAYHRLDLGLTIDPDPRRQQAWRGRWIFSIYNLYARRNPYSVFFKTINDRSISTRNRSNAFQLSVIGSLVPSVAYEFSF